MSEVEISKLNEKIKNYGETIKKLHGINEMNKSKYTEECNALKDQLAKKEEENRILSDKLKVLEKKNEDIYKNVTSGNISDVNEIRKSFENEKLILIELIKTYKSGIEEKSEYIQNLNLDLTLLRNELDEEKKKNENLLNLNLSKYDQKSQEMQFFKISTENSSLKTKLINLEDKAEKLSDQIEKLNSQKLDTEKFNKESFNLLKKELEVKNASYQILVKDYQNSLNILTRSHEDLERSKYLNVKYEKDNLALERKIQTLEHEIIDLKSENLGSQTRIKGLEIEMESNRKKVKEYESKLADYKLSKQVFEVTYIYLRMPLEGRITFQKEGEQYLVFIHNRTATRKYTFLELDIFKDTHENNKLLVRFVKENTQEEYFCNELPRLLEYYEEYKKKAIEITDFSNNKKNDITNSEKKKLRVGTQLQDMFDI